MSKPIENIGDLQNYLQYEVNLITNDPKLSKETKVFIQNLAGAHYYSQGIGAITNTSLKQGVLSPFASMKSTIGFQNFKTTRM